MTKWGRFNFLFRVIQFIRLAITNITIEPALFLLSFSGNLEDISVNQMLIYKSCRVDFNFNETVCDNLVTDFKEENDLVQNEVGSHHQCDQKKLPNDYKSCPKMISLDK